MASIPSINRNRVSKSPTPGVRLNPNAPIEAFGGNNPVYGQLAGLGQDATKRFYNEAQEQEDARERARVEANQMASMEMASKLSAEESRLRTKLKGVKGKEAQRAAMEAAKEYEKFYTDNTKGISDPDLQRRVRAHYLQYNDSLNGFAQDYAAQETRRFDNDTSEELVKNETALAIDAWNDDARVELALARIAGAYESYAARNGMPEGWADNQTRRASNAVHEGILARKLEAQDIDGARAFYEKYKDSFTKPRQEQIDRAIKEEDVRKESQEHAATFVDAFDTEEMALEAARAIVEPKLQDATVKRVKELWNEKQEQLKAVKKQNFEDAARYIEETGELPPALIDFTADEREKLRGIRAKLREPQGVETDDQEYYRLWDMATNPETRSDFLNTNIWHSAGKLSKEHREELLKEQRSMAKGDIAAAEKRDGAFTKSQIWESTLRDNGFMEKDSDPKKRASFRRQFDAAVRRMEKETKKELNTEEYQKVLDGMLLDYEGKKVYEREAELEAPGLDMIPEAERKALIDAANKLIPGGATEERIKSVWRRYIRRFNAP